MYRRGSRSLTGLESHDNEKKKKYRCHHYYVTNATNPNSEAMATVFHQGLARDYLLREYST